ncbi:ABC transporter permease [Streptococcus sp. X13SY08]|uniref:ABC transporter permease n=1 Tax=Streptococcus sp. X13SY08 TaxID=1676616 RepID=UPI000AB7C908|nr:ABC transporter permease [Streptococcus sp. X13SY08]
MEESKAQIDSGWQELQAAQADLLAQIDALAQAGEDLANHPEIQEAQSQLATKEQGLLAAQAQYDTGNQAYQSALAQYQTQSTAFQEGREQYNQGLADYQNGLAQYDAGMSQYQDSLAQYQAGQSEYETGFAQYQSGLAQYQSGLDHYQKGLTDFKSGRGQIDQTKEEIASNQSELDQSKKKLAEGQKDLDKESKDAITKISDARADLAEAEKNLKNLEEPSYISYTRATIPGGNGYQMYKASTSSISAVGNVFPIVIYVVAAMVTFMTMTRFVDEERTNAGIFKALGYTNKDIIRKFLLYGFVASMAGTIVGILAGNFILSPLIGRIITKTKVIGASELYFYPLWTILAVILGLFSAVLPAYLVARKELTEKPAQLLQAKPPVSGSTILLEKIGFIWKRLSFTHKVTARNIFRYKQRMLMTIFGVAGSVALLFGGLGIRSSISGIANTQFSDIIRYDILVTENSKASEQEKADLTDLLASTTISQQLPVTVEQLEEKIDGVDEAQSISLLITDKPSEIHNFIQLRHRVSKEKIKLDNQGVVLSEKLASLYGIKVGDTIPLTLEDEVVQVRVSGISELYASHFVYMTADYYEKLTGTHPVKNSYLLKVNNQDHEAIKTLAADFLKLDAVEAVVQHTAVISQIATLVDSLQSVMVILIVLSILLGVVILYNLTNINVAERIRELSTIKVLGFHSKEVTMYIYRETIVLSIVGILLGLLGGVGLHRVLLSVIGPSNMMFQSNVTLDVYLIPIFAIVGILAILGWFVNYKLCHVDMLEALKSVE